MPAAVDGAPARLYLGDCLDRLRELDAESVDAVITDPPYGLEFMGKDWDRFTDGDLVTRTGHDRAGSGAGFAEAASLKTTLPTFGGKLSSYECAACGVRDAFRKGCRCETPDWRAINPNGTAHALAFQRFCFMWAEAVYRALKPGGHVLAFGAPRTYHRLAAALEDAGFEVRDSLHWIYGSGFPKSLDVAKALDKQAGHWRGRAGEVSTENDAMAGPNYTRTDKGDAVTDAAREWEGWGTALKPAHEPIILARKPLAGTVIENVVAHGTGALHLEATKIGTTGGTRQVTPKAGASGGEATSYGASIGSASGGNEDAGGRWPANVVLSHLEECKGHGARHTETLCAPGCPVAELNEMSGEVGGGFGTRGRGDGERGIFPGLRGEGQVVGFGDEGGAARFFYISKPGRRERLTGSLVNLHPTIKPVELMRYLVRLVTPPDGVVLDPFMGSGTTGLACALEGVAFVGFERDPESFEVSHSRIADWSFANGRPAPLDF